MVLERKKSWGMRMRIVGHNRPLVGSLEKCMSWRRFIRGFMMVKVGYFMMTGCCCCCCCDDATRISNSSLSELVKKQIREEERIRKYSREREI